MRLPYCCLHCQSELVMGICPECSKQPRTTTNGTTNDVPCDASKPPAATVVETSMTIRESVRQLLVFWLYAEQKPCPTENVSAQQLIQWRDDAIAFYRNDNLFYHKVLDLSARLDKYLCSDERDLTAAQLQIDRLKAEVAARYTIPEIRAWKQASNGSITLDDPDHGIAAWAANQRKEKGT